MSILISDYDGTFANGESNIRMNCQVIHSFLKDGNMFVLSSGRSYDSLLRKVRDYGIPYSYLATADGSYLFDSNGNLLLSHKVSHDIVERVIQLKNMSNCKRMDYAYEREYSSFYKEKENFSSVSLVIDRQDITSSFVETFSTLKKENTAYDYCIYGYEDEFYFMVKARGISKSSPILYLQKKLLIPKEEIYTVGDNLNDLEMIRDFNGFVIGDNEDLFKEALDRYDSVHSLVGDIAKKKVKRRF